MSNSVNTIDMSKNNNNFILTEEEDNGFFLPDFCQAGSVFMVVLVSELLALILSLVQFQSETFWLQLGRISLIIQWIALLSTALSTVSCVASTTISDSMP